MGLAGQETARTIAVLGGALSIIAAVAIVASMVNKHKVVPIAAFTLFFACLLAEPVTTTLRLTNINGFLLLLEVLFVWSAVRVYQAHRTSDRNWWQRSVDELRSPWACLAAACLMCAVAVKPQFVVMAMIPLGTLQLGILVLAFAMFLVVYAAGTAVMADPGDYLTHVVPHLSEPRNSFNEAIGTQLANRDINESLGTLLVSALCMVSLLALYFLMRWVDVDTVMWSFATIGVLLPTIFMVTGFLQGYYSMWLLPLIPLTLAQRTPMRNPVLWLALWFTSTDSSRPTEFFPVLDGYPIKTIGWVLIPVLILAWSVWDAWRERDFTAFGASTAESAGAPETEGGVLAAEHSEQGAQNELEAPETFGGQVKNAWVRDVESDALGWPDLKSYAQALKASVAATGPESTELRQSDLEQSRPE